MVEWDKLAKMRELRENLQKLGFKPCGYRFATPLTHRRVHALYDIDAHTVKLPRRY